MSGAITFNTLAPVTLRNRTLLRSFLVMKAKEHGRKVDQLNYIFCTDDYLLSLNKEYLQHDTYTDIITFQYNGSKEPLHSDIYISIDRVRENARAYGNTITNELHRVILHGLLHLLGYKDKSAADQKKMRQMEDQLLNEFFDK